MGKKGITAVVAIVLLLMMTVAAAGLAYMWVGGLQKGAQDTGTQGVNQIQQQAQTSLKADSMWNNSLSNISIALRNTGTTAVDLGAAGTAYYLNGQAATITGFSGQSLAPNQVLTINTNVSFPSVAQTKIIRLATPGGYDISFTCDPTTAGPGVTC
ncbi:Uncharacterised protein [uncultured archaeon]|nr:Uncharacterised protein [uncultured archaeon]